MWPSETKANINTSNIDNLENQNGSTPITFENTLQNIPEIYFIGHRSHSSHRSILVIDPIIRVIIIIIHISHQPQIADLIYSKKMSIKNVVERLQLQLLLNGYSVPLTGKIENETRNAIKKYQKAKVGKKQD